MTERVETVRAFDPKTELSLPKAVGNVARKQMGDIALRMDPLDYEVRKQYTANGTGSFRGLDDP